MVVCGQRRAARNQGDAAKDGRRCGGRGFAGEGVRRSERVALHSAVFLQADECTRVTAVVVVDGECIVAVDADV